MKSLGMTGPAMPRAKPGDHERALALLAATADAKVTKARLLELRDATAAHDKSREEAEAATAKAKQRESEAQAAEADAIRARQALADDSAKARDELGKRETAVAERERLVTEAEQSQEAQDTELTRREVHLREAGVRGF